MDSVSLDYIVTSRPGWASDGDPASNPNLILSPVILWPGVRRAEPRVCLLPGFLVAHIQRCSCESVQSTPGSFVRVQGGIVLVWLVAWNLRSGRAKVIPASYRPSDSRPDQAVFLFCSENWPFPLCSISFKPKARQSSPRMHAGVVALLPLIICSGTLPPPGCELQVQPRSHLLGAESPPSFLFLDDPLLLVLLVFPFRTF